MQTFEPSTDRRRDGPAAPQAGRRASGWLLRSLMRATIALGVGAALLLLLGFVWFVSMLPTEDVTLDRNADGIVALTGGASRVTDALDLLAAKRGQRLLISGANRSTNAGEISRLHPEYASVVHCCVDFDRSLNTLGNAVETRRWVHEREIRSLIVVTSAYHIPRAMAELAHQLPDVTLIPFPVFSEKLRSERWWSDAAIARLIVLEYLKFVLSHVRMQIGRGPDDS